MCTTSHFYQYQFHRSHIGFTLFVTENKNISIVLQIQNNIFKVFSILKKNTFFIIYSVLIHVYIKCSNKNKNSNNRQQQKKNYICLIAMRNISEDFKIIFPFHTHQFNLFCYSCCAKRYFTCELHTILVYTQSFWKETYFNPSIYLVCRIE